MSSDTGMSTDDTRPLPPYGPPRPPYAGSGTPYADPHRTWYGGTLIEERPPAPPMPPAEPPRRASGWRRRAAAGVTVLAVAVGSGAAGAAIALEADDSTAPTTVSASPVAGGSRPTEQLARVAAAVQPSVVSIQVRASGGSGEGSGVVLRSDGTILTNNHVVEGAAEGGQISVKFADGRTAAADIVGRDPSTDLAVIRARGVSDAKPATLGSSDGVHVGDAVLAIGSPLGLEGSVSAGIVSALHRPVGVGRGTQISDAIQTDAAINPGNSGGALVDAQGRVIGINSAIATLGSGGLGGQSGNIGLGFAIPIDEAKRVADQLLKGQQPTRAVLGVQAADAPDGGALLDAVTPGSAAERAGLRTGDVVVRVEDRAVDDAAALTAAIRSHDPGDSVRIVVRRGGEERTFTAALGSATG